MALHNNDQNGRQKTSGASTPFGKLMITAQGNYSDKMKAG